MLTFVERCYAASRYHHANSHVIRTQIQLTEEQDRALEALAAAEDVSKAALVRRAVDLLLSQRGGADRAAQRARAFAAVGMVTGDGAPVSTEHDRFLADAYAYASAGTSGQR